MPSQAFKKFCKNLVDVDRLIQVHVYLKTGGKGKQGLGHLTRSGVVMLCAAWEIYIESLIEESIEVLLAHVDSPKSLPLTVQKELSKAVKTAKHELKPLDLAGDGWRLVYTQRAKVLLSGFNTPKTGPIETLFKKLIGYKVISEDFSEDLAAQVDDFVKARGEIAHKGREAKYIRINQLKQYRKITLSAVKEIDNATRYFLNSFLNLSHNSPWYPIGDDHEAEANCGETWSEQTRVVVVDVATLEEEETEIAQAQT